MNDLGNELGDYRDDLSGKEFRIYDDKHDNNYSFIIPRLEEVSFVEKEDAICFLNDLGISPDVYVSISNDGITLRVDRKLLEALISGSGQPSEEF